MAKNKKPRKKHIPLQPSIGMSPESVANMHNELVLSSLRVMELLPKGEATIADMLMVRELIGTTIVGSVSRGCISADDANYSAELMDNASFCIANVLKRSDSVGRLVCKGEELNTILDALYIASEFMKDSLDTCPFTVCVERLVALDILKKEYREHLLTVDNICEDIKARVAVKRKELAKKLRGMQAVKAALIRKYGSAGAQMRGGTIRMKITRKVNTEAKTLQEAVSEAQRV